MKTEIFSENIAPAAEIIKSGGLVAVPTETVYGLAGNGLDEGAVKRIYEVKGRPPVKPLSLMVSGAEDIEKYCRDVPAGAYRLAKKFWPGPLTIVLKARNVVPELVRAGGETVGLRCPAHPLTLALIREAGVPLAAPSANPSGEPSPVTAGEVQTYFDNNINGIIDGGPCTLGTESTIIDMSGTPYRILRSGALTAEDVFGVLTAELCIVGITGGTGCGKTTALEILKEMGALVIDCDAVYHELCRDSGEMLSELDSRFPGTVENGVLLRKKLGSVVFSDEKALLDLNAITHKYVNRRVNELLEEWAKNGGRVAAVDAIALLESGLQKLCSVVVGVTAPEESRVRRLMAREGISEEYARLRISAQKPNEYFKKNCGYTLDNDGTMAEFEVKCRNLFEKILIKE